MTLPTNSLTLKREYSSTTLVTDNKSTSGNLSSKNKEDNHYCHSTELNSQRRLLICTLNHVNKYDIDLNLSSYSKVFVSNSDNRINYLRYKIESSPELYMINDWTKGAFNRERIINLQVLFSEVLSLRTAGETARYEGLKFAITDNCWEQMSELLEVAESIPDIGKTWLALVLVLLSKFPYYQSSTLKIKTAHYKAIRWSVFGPFTIAKHINPLRTNLLNDPIIPENIKLTCFCWIIDRRVHSEWSSERCGKGRDMLCKDLTYEVFIDDDKWNSHIENILLTQIQPYPPLTFF